MTSKKKSNQNLNNKIEVIKYNGEKEPFSINKVYNSALRAGASFSLAKQISIKIENEIYPNIKTSEIFEKVKKELRNQNSQLSIKFSLKEGIRKLGPEGFLFETFIRKILSNYCLKIREGRIISGKGSKYELDFLAEKNDKFYAGECKYRNKSNCVIDINVCLKSFAILEDIKDNVIFKDKELYSFIVTNSRFTNEAIKYSTCKGIKLLGWKYPEKRGLEKLIEEKKLYPATILPSLHGKLIHVFEKEGIVLAKEVLDIDIEKFSKTLNISKKVLESLKKEAEILINKK
jgi:hypothetical protein